MTEIAFDFMTPVRTGFDMLRLLLKMIMMIPPEMRFVLTLLVAFFVIKFIIP